MYMHIKSSKFMLFTTAYSAVYLVSDTNETIVQPKGQILSIICPATTRYSAANLVF